MCFSHPFYSSFASTVVDPQVSQICGTSLDGTSQFQIFYFMITSFRARTSSYLFWSGYCYPMKLLFTPEATCPYNLLSNGQIIHMDSESGPHNTSCAASNKHTYLALRVGNSEYLS